MGFSSQETLIHCQWRLEVALSYWYRRRDNLLAWGNLFANPYELKSRIWVWEEYNHFERIYRVIYDRFLSNFAKTSEE